MEKEKEIKFDLSKLDNETQSLYMEARIEYKEIIESVFTIKDGVVSNAQNRPEPPYAKGTLDKPYFEGGMPIQKKPRELVNAILSGDYRFIEIEGGKRGAKDIYGLFGWAKYLMICPEKVHLATGSSLEHVLRTVLMSDGFGLYFTIPHGIFVRETIAGAQRGIYKFLDNYGLEKQVLFYGNEKENDKNKFQGFTLGSVYVNEALNQHPNGINEADDRIASTRQPLIITTQNPKGEAHRFYQEVEKPKLTTIENIKELEYVRDHYKDSFNALKTRLLQDREIEKRKIINDIKNQYTASKIKELPNQKQIELNQTMLDINYEFDKIIRNYSAEDFASDYIFQTKEEKRDWEKFTISKQLLIEKQKQDLEDFDFQKEMAQLKSEFYNKYKDKYLLQKSMASIVGFTRGGDNPNKIYNAYNFYYAHFNVDDNLYMTEMQRNNYKNSRAVGTAGYDQDIIGLRRSAEGAIYDTFTNDNIFSGNIKDFNWEGLQRAIVIDPGFNHPTGMTDWAVDTVLGKAWCLQERLIDFKIEYIGQKSLDTIYAELLTLIRGAKNRAMPDYVIVDPSKPELIDYLNNANIPVYKADNWNWTTRQKEKEISEEITPRELRGIPLVQTMFAKLKLMIHESCILTIKQIGSYSYEKNESGKDDLPKLNDDLVVTIKYLVNTLGFRPSQWEYEELSEDGIDNGQLSEDEKEKNSKRDLADAIRMAQEEINRETGNFFGQSDNRAKSIAEELVGFTDYSDIFSGGKF